MLDLGWRFTAVSLGNSLVTQGSSSLFSRCKAAHSVTQAAFAKVSSIPFQTPSSMNARPRFFPSAVRLGAVVLAVIAALLPAEATAARVQVLKSTLTADARGLDVTVPADCGAVTVQRRQIPGGWRDILTAAASQGVMRVALPDLGKRPKVRAIIASPAVTGPRGKFPTTFYLGRNSFDASYRGSSGGLRGLAGDFLTPTVPMANDIAGTPTSPPEEADIWKTDGTMVYYFNQLRGLQVLDLADPADPRLVATLRLPAVGQDLYLLPGSGPVRHLVLLTRDDGTSGKTVIHLAKVAGGTAEITHSKVVDGDLMESRLAGNRLFLLTSLWNSPVATGGVISSVSTVSTTLSQWLIEPDAGPVPAGETVVSGGSPVVASGAGWLAVAVSPAGEWNVSDIHAFRLTTDGASRLTAGPVRTEGRVGDKFKMQWNNNVLTTISQRSLTDGVWSPTTVLENFHADGPSAIGTKLGSLELAKGESLFATRFAGNKAYIVTFLRTDPLWVVDLSNPAAPVVAGHLEVPGWSTHLEPVGDMLFSIGWEGGTIAASLFDVADPAAPALLRRINLPGSHSESVWDEKALKVLPDQGLVLVPMTSYDNQSGEALKHVQLLDLDLAARDLRLRGTIAHSFEPRRSAMLGQSVVSISQRALVTTDVSDRDQPALLAQVMLAWPVDRVFASGDHLVHIENGSHWSGGWPTARVTPATSPDAVLAEVELGDGEVVTAALRDGKLYVVRELPADGEGGVVPQIARFAGLPAGSGVLSLDIYDATSLPSLPLLGSCEVATDAASRLQTGDLLWPQPNRPCLVIESQPYYFWWRGGPVIDLPMVGAPASVADSRVSATSPLIADPGFGWPSGSQPRLIVFDVATPANPTVAAPLDLGTNGTTLPEGRAANDGLVVVGADSWTEKQDASALSHTVRVIEVPVSGIPSLRPAIDLPGSLFGVTELDRNGFLAFSRAWNGDGGSSLQASACDGRDAYLVDSLPDVDAHAVAAGGRRLSLASGDEVERHLLQDDGRFAAQPSLAIGWEAWDLRWLDGILLGSSGRSLFAADDTMLEDWQFPMWGLGLDSITKAADGDLLVPLGDYGAERLDR